MHPQDTSFLVDGFKPTVALQDPATVMAKVQAVRNAQQQQQLTGVQIQDAQVGLQEKQRDLNDQKILGDAMAANGGDIEKALPVAMQNGLSPKGMFSMQQMLLTNRKTQAGIGKDNADAASAAAAAKGKQNEMVAGAASTLLNLAPSARAAAYPAAMQQIAKDMGVDPASLPQDYAAFGASMNMDPDHALLQFRDQHLNNSEQLAQQKAASEKAAADQKLVEDQAEAARKAVLHPLAVTKATNEATTTTPNAAGLTPEQQKAADDRAAALKHTTLDDARKNAIQQADLKIKKDTFTATFGGGGAVGADGKPLHGEDFLKTLPQGRAAQVKAFASGAMDESDLPRGNAKQPFIDAVMQFDPTFNKQRAQTLKSFGPAGQTGQNIQALNTAPVHLEQLDQAATAMGNKTFVPTNRIMQDTIQMFGGAAPTNFDGVKAAVKSEMATALKGNATDQEIAEIGKTVDRAASPAALHGIVNENLKILGAKLNTKDEAYHQDPGTGDPNWQPVMPAAQKVFDAHGIQPIQRLAIDPKLKAYAVEHFGGDVNAAKAAIAKQQAGK